MLRTGPVTPKQLRSFGLIVGGVFALIGVWPLVYHGEPLRFWALAPAVLLIPPALVYPKVLKPFYRVWMAIGHVMGAIMTRLIMGISFYLIITPIGFVFRLLGKDSMRLREGAAEGGTYRIVREARPGDHMRHQF